MEASEIQDVCRLCPETGSTETPLLNIFNRKNPDKNMKEVIFVTTGIEISESDLISTKICSKCYQNTKNISDIRQIAKEQDLQLKTKCQEYLIHRGLRVPNTCITIKCPPAPSKEKPEAPPKKRALDEVPHSSKSNVITPSKLETPVKISKGVHQSVIDVYRRNPKYKLPKKCLHRDIAPTVSLGMGEVESYFRKRKLDMSNYVYRPKVARTSGTNLIFRRVARKKTAVPFKARAQSMFSAIPISEVIDRTTNSEKVIAKSEDNGGSSPSNKIKESSVDVTVQASSSSRKPGPKSKTIDLNKSLPALALIHKPGPKCNSRSLQENVSSPSLTTQPGPKSKTTNLIIKRSPSNFPSSSSAYRPGPKSKTSAINSSKNDQSISSPALPAHKPGPKSKTASLINYQVDSSTKIATLTKTAKHSPTHKPGPKSKTLTLLRSPPKPGPTPTNATKPEFIQSLGLTPATGSVKCPSILICKVCNLVHSNVAALKKHSSRHRVCEYCKLKFKTVERKQNHEENDCEVRRILEAPGSFVDLEKIEQNLKVRRQFKLAFAGFEAIAGLDDPETCNVIVLTDDDEVPLNRDEVIEVEDCATMNDGTDPDVTIVESCSNVSPVIVICHDTVLDRLKVPTAGASDKTVVKELISLLSSKSKVSAALGTEMLLREDPLMMEDGGCVLKNFKDNFFLYTIPITFSIGAFKVSYGLPLSEDVNPDLSGSWGDLPLVEKQSSKTPTSEVPMINTTYPLTFVTSQVQSSQLSVSSIQLMTTSPTMSIFLPNTSAFLQGTGLSIQPNLPQTHQTLNNGLFNQLGNTSIQTAPLVQNYTLSMGPLPVLNNQQIPVAAGNSSPRNSEANNGEPSGSGTGTIGSGGGGSAGGSSTAKELVLSKGDKVVVSPKISGKGGKSKDNRRSKRPIIKVKIGNLSSSRGSSRGGPRGSKTSKLRVKNIWELK